MRLPSIKLPSPGRVYIPGPHMPRISGKVRYRFVNKGHRIANYMARWEKSFLFRAGAQLRSWTLSSFKRRKDKKIHSPIMKPPYMHLKKKDFIKGAIQFAVDLAVGKVLVGVSYRKAKLWGVMHEKGGFWDRTKTGGMAYHPPRPFMKPAFNRWKKYGLPVIMKDTRNKILGR